MLVKKHGLKFVLFVTALAICLAACGCMIGQPGYDTRKIDAEYNIKESGEGKVLVLVNEPAWTQSSYNMRYSVSTKMQDYLIDKAGLAENRVISYDSLVKFRESSRNFSSLSPAQVGKELDADLVLYIVLAGSQIEEVAQTGYYDGYLAGSASLIDVKTSEKLWPKEEKRKIIRVGFDAGERKPELAAAKLAAAFSHCTGRYLYNCKAKNFAIMEDRSNNAWENWNF